MNRNLSIIALVIALLGTSLFVYTLNTDASFYPVQGTQFYLSGAGITSTQNTIQLTSFQTPDGRPYTMSMFGYIGYGALEPGTSKLEDISFSGITQNTNGSAILTGVTRGNDFVTPYTASSSLAKSHAGGATFILTNTSGFYGNEFVFTNQSQTLNGNYTFTGQTTFNNFPITPTNTFANVNVVGISQFATPSQQAAGTATSTNGTVAPLVLSSQYATSTFNKATASNQVVVTNILGHIDAGFVASSTQFSVTGTTTLSATSSVSIGAFPAWDIGKQEAIFSITGTSTFAVPVGVPEIYVELVAGGGGSINGSGSGTPGAGGGGYSAKIVNVSATTSIQVYVGSGGSVGNSGQWSTFGTNGSYFYANGGTNNATGGCGMNGDINACGSAGSPAYSSLGGIGGGSFFGGGGGQNAVGQNYGGGAGGAASSGGGNAGGNGIVIVRW